MGWLSADPFMESAVLLWSLSSWHQCKGLELQVAARCEGLELLVPWQGCILTGILVSGVLTACYQLRFYLYSGAVITKALSTVVSLLLTSGLWLCEVILCLTPLV